MEIQQIQSSMEMIKHQELNRQLDDSATLRSPYDGSPYTSSNLKTDEQPNCSGSDCLQHPFPDGKPGRGLPSIDELKMDEEELS